VLRPGGLACVRCFVRPERERSVAQLLAELRDAPSGLDLFRWRLAMAVQGTRWGVSLTEVWQAWNASFPDRGALPGLYGWTAAQIERIERWRDTRARYAFPSLTELRQLAAPRFDVLECEIPTYPLGEHFPRVTMRSRA
jgi:hypothetical protein